MTAAFPLTPIPEPPANTRTVLVKPTLRASTIYDDNIFRRDRARKASSIVVLGAGATAETDWRRHALAAEAAVEAGAFTNSSDDDYLDGSVSIRADIDATRALRARRTTGVVGGGEPLRSTTELPQSVQPRDYDSLRPA